MKGQGGHDIFTHNPNGDLRGFKSQKDEHCEEMPLTPVPYKRFHPN